MLLYFGIRHTVLLTQAFTVTGEGRMAVRRDGRTLHVGPTCLCYITYLRTEFFLINTLALRGQPFNTRCGVFFFRKKNNLFTKLAQKNVCVRKK